MQSELLIELSKLKPRSYSDLSLSEYMFDVRNVLKNRQQEKLLDQKNLEEDDEKFSKLLFQCIFIKVLSKHDQEEMGDSINDASCYQFNELIKAKIPKNPAMIEKKITDPVKRYVDEDMPEYLCRISRCFKYRGGSMDSTEEIALYRFADIFFLGHQHDYKSEWNEHGQGPWNESFSGFKCPNDIKSWALQNKKLYNRYDQNKKPAKGDKYLV